MLFGQVAGGAIALATIIPALLIVWVGERLALKSPPQNGTRRLVLFLLFSSTAILLLFSINAQNFSSGDIPIPILVLFPTLTGLLALLFVRRGDVLAIWRMDKWLVSVLLTAIIILLASLGRSGEALYTPLIIFLVAFLTAVAWELSRRLSLNILEIGGGFVAALLFLDAVGAIDGPTVMSSDWLRGFYTVIKPVFFILALTIIAALIHRITIAPTNGGETRSNPGLAVVVILLLAICVVMVRKAVLVDATGRAAEDHIPLIEIFFAILIGMVVVGVSQDRARAASIAYIILIPVLISGAYALGWLVEPQVITQARANRIAVAVEHYQQDNGFYPSRLEALTPQYMPFILGPLTGRGQVWCYQGKTENYRLGYVYYQRYYRDTYPDPYFEIRTHATGGDTLLGPWMCDEELEKYKKIRGL